MAKYILKRLAFAVLSLFAITAIIFILLRQMPIEGYLGAAVEKMSPEAIENSLRQLGLLDPVPVQLKNFYVNLFQPGGMLSAELSKVGSDIISARIGGPVTMQPAVVRHVEL